MAVLCGFYHTASAVTYSPITYTKTSYPRSSYSSPSRNQGMAATLSSPNAMATYQPSAFRSTSVYLSSSAEVLDQTSTPFGAPPRSVRRDSGPYDETFGFGTLDQLEGEPEIGILADMPDSPIGEPLILLCLACLYCICTFLKKRSTSTQ